MSKTTNEELLEQLRVVARQLRRTPTQNDLRWFARPSYSMLRRRFGTYAAACEAAGLAQNVGRVAGVSELTLDELAAKLRGYAKALGRTPTQADMKRAPADVPAQATYRARFGSWAAALKRAGLQPRAVGAAGHLFRFERHRT
jgi:Homing endonuclease associated repeat